jgi:hypothetical protein
MSLMALSEGECIDVPSGTSVIRDIRIAPSGTRAPGRLALVASLGKKLTVFRYGHFFLALFQSYFVLVIQSSWKSLDEFMYFMDLVMLLLPHIISGRNWLNRFVLCFLQFREQ